MNTLHIDLKNYPELKDIFKSAFPDYKGNTHRIIVTDKPIELTSYWSEGSKDTYSVIRLSDMKVVRIPENGPGYYHSELDERIQVPCAGYIVIEKKIFCGKNHGLRMYINPADTSKAMLPEPMKLTWNMKVVLSATTGLKSSYAGIKNYRFREANQRTGISLETWNATIAELIENGLLRKNKAITSDGRNAIGNTDLWQLKPDLAICE